MKKNNLFPSVSLSIFLVSLLLTVVSACKEDDEPRKSNTDFLTAKKWKPVQIETTLNGSGNQNGMEECNNDDVLTFTSDGRFFSDRGSNHCDQDDINQSGTWAWKDTDEKILRTTADTEVKDSEFVRLSDTSFKITYAEKFDLDRDGVDDEIKLIITYTAL